MKFWVVTLYIWSFEIFFREQKLHIWSYKMSFVDDLNSLELDNENATIFEKRLENKRNCHNNYDNSIQIEMFIFVKGKGEMWNMLKPKKN